MEICHLGMKLGKGIRRDCAHSPLLPVTAEVALVRAQKVVLRGIICPKTGYPVVEPAETAIFFGVVDPFLDEEIRPGDCFYVMVQPGTVTSLRHVWTHPDLMLGADSVAR